MKIMPEDNAIGVAMKMGEGNPGALEFCMELMKLGADGLTSILALDCMEVYGERLYMLWNDCCGRDAQKVVRVIKARAHGKISTDDISTHIKGNGYRGTPFDDSELEYDDSNDETETETEETA